MPSLTQERFSKTKYCLANSSASIFRGYTDQCDVRNQRPQIFKSHITDQFTFPLSDYDLPLINLAFNDLDRDEGVLPYKI